MSWWDLDVAVVTLTFKILFGQDLVKNVKCRE